MWVTGRCAGWDRSVWRIAGWYCSGSPGFASLQVQGRPIPDPSAWNSPSNHTRSHQASTQAGFAGQPCETALDPPPAHPSIAHEESIRPDWVS